MTNTEIYTLNQHGYYLDCSGEAVRWVAPNMDDFLDAVGRARTMRELSALWLADAVVSEPGLPASEDKLYVIEWRSRDYRRDVAEFEQLNALANFVFAPARAGIWAGRVVREAQL